jgi:RHS repeat-associated protein
VRSGTVPTDYTFTGQKRDNDAGLHFYNARYYDSGLGRFTQPDTIVPNMFNPQSLNRYAYVLNNPVKYTDPMGHEYISGADQRDQLNTESDSTDLSIDDIIHLYLGDHGGTSEYFQQNGKRLPTAGYIIQLARTGQLYEKTGIQGIKMFSLWADATLGALMATGEMNEYCNDSNSCHDAYAAVLTTVVMRYDEGKGFKRLDGINSYGSLMAAECDSATGCSQYKGLNNWIQGNGNYDLNAKAYQEKLQFAFLVAIEVFGGGQLYTDVAKDKFTYFGKEPNGTPMWFGDINRNRRPTYFRR